jgi:hypothetical protein
MITHSFVKKFWRSSGMAVLQLGLSAEERGGAVTEDLRLSRRA